MLVKLKQEWLGHPAGSTVTVARSKRADLVHRGIAADLEGEFVDKPEPKPEKIETVPENVMDEITPDEPSMEPVEEETELDSKFKQVKAPKKNKQVRSSKNK